MIERFEGDEGVRLLRDALLNQVIVKGDGKIADSLVGVVQLSELADGEVLIAQDHEDNDLFFIIAGSMRIVANGQEVAIRPSGTHVGEMAMIDCKARRSATVVAAETAVVAKLNELVFTRIANDHPDLWRRIAIELCDRLRNRNKLIRRPNEVPHVFICSSSEHLAIAEQIQLKLDYHHSNVRIWTDQVFGPMKYPMEDLEREILKADFAIAVITADDVVRSRGKQSVTPRDNVVFELGLFMGQLGRGRTIIVCPRGVEFKLPSDLLGLNPLTFSPPADIKDAGQQSVPGGVKPTYLKDHGHEVGHPKLDDHDFTASVLIWNN